MSANTTTEHIKSAQKSHRCDWCWTHIKAGEPYAKYRWFDGGDAATVKMHEECYTAMQITVEQEGGGEIEIYPGSNYRGHFCGMDKNCDCEKVVEERRRNDEGAPQ